MKNAPLFHSFFPEKDYICFQLVSKGSLFMDTHLKEPYDAPRSQLLQLQHGSALLQVLSPNGLGERDPYTPDDTNPFLGG